MDPSEYETMFQVEDRHWWYAGMRRISTALLDQSAGRRPGLVLDAGCGTGANLIFLEPYGQATGIDIEPVALSLCRQRRLTRLAQGSVTALPFPAETFDLVTSFEVLYHMAVASDELALAEFWRVLKPGGWLLVRLPAHDWLRGRHDVAVHTRHRYSAPEVRRKVTMAGFQPLRVSYANCLLFPVAVARRLAEGLWPRSMGSDVGPPPRGNALLSAILSVEAVWLRRWSLPWGLSVVCLARKP
jgi:SAM-dependent methyltransferase